MYPDKHFRDLESSLRRKKLLQDLTASTVFLASFIFVGPFIHEISHVAVLEALSCRYAIDTGFTWLSGFFASIKPYCTPSKGSLLLFYSVGYISTIVSGAAVNFSGRNSDTATRTKLTAAAGTGILLSTVLSLSAEGDIPNFLRILGVPGYSLLVTLLLTLGVFSLSLGGLKDLLD